MTIFKYPEHGFPTDTEVLELANGLAHSFSLTIEVNGLCSRTLTLAALTAVCCYVEQMEQAAKEQNDPDFLMNWDTQLLPEAQRLGKVMLAQIESDEATQH